VASIRAAFAARSDPNDWTHDGNAEGWKVIDRTFTKAEARYIPNGPGSTTDMAQGAAFMVWLVLLLFLDLILLGVMIQGKVSPEIAVTLALANPLQVFRTAALALFDPQLIVLGPSAYVILDLFGTTGYKIFALAYPAALGLLSATIGYFLFRRGDLP